MDFPQVQSSISRFIEEVQFLQNRLKHTNTSIETVDFSKFSHLDSLVRFNIPSNVNKICFLNELSSSLSEQILVQLEDPLEIAVFIRKLLVEKATIQSSHWIRYTQTSTAAARHYVSTAIQSKIIPLINGDEENHKRHVSYPMFIPPEDPSLFIHTHSNTEDTHARQPAANMRSMTNNGVSLFNRQSSGILTNLSEGGNSDARINGKNQNATFFSTSTNKSGLFRVVHKPREASFVTAKRLLSRLPSVSGQGRLPPQAPLLSGHDVALPEDLPPQLAAVLEDDNEELSLLGNSPWQSSKITEGGAGRLSSTKVEFFNLVDQDPDSEGEDGLHTENRKRKSIRSSATHKNSNVNISGTSSHKSTHIDVHMDRDRAEERLKKMLNTVDGDELNMSVHENTNAFSNDTNESLHESNKKDNLLSATEYLGGPTFPEEEDEDELFNPEDSEYDSEDEDGDDGGIVFDLPEGYLPPMIPKDEFQISDEEDVEDDGEIKSLISHDSLNLSERRNQNSLPTEQINVKLERKLQMNGPQLFTIMTDGTEDDDRSPFLLHSPTSANSQMHIHDRSSKYSSSSNSTSLSGPEQYHHAAVTALMSMGISHPTEGQIATLVHALTSTQQTPSSMSHTPNVAAEASLISEQSSTSRPVEDSSIAANSVETLRTCAVAPKTPEEEKNSHTPELPCEPYPDFTNAEATSAGIEFTETVVIEEHNENSTLLKFAELKDTNLDEQGLEDTISSLSNKKSADIEKATLPEEALRFRISRSVSFSNGDNTTTNTKSTDMDVSDPAVAALLSSAAGWKGWRLIATTSGRMFYHNSERRESVWRQPIELDELLGTWIVRACELPNKTALARLDGRPLLDSKGRLILFSTSSTNLAGMDGGLVLLRDPRSHTDVFSAAFDNNTRFLQLYLDGAKGNPEVEQQGSGMKPIHYAVKGVGVSALLCLAAAEVNIDAKDKFERSPIWFSLSNPRMFAALVKLGAKVDDVPVSVGGPSLLHVVVHQAMSRIISINEHHAHDFHFLHDRFNLPEKHILDDIATAPFGSGWVRTVRQIIRHGGGSHLALKRDSKSRTPSRLLEDYLEFIQPCEKTSNLMKGLKIGLLEVLKTAQMEAEIELKKVSAPRISLFGAAKPVKTIGGNEDTGGCSGMDTIRGFTHINNDKNNIISVGNSLSNNVTSNSNNNNTSNETLNVSGRTSILGRTSTAGEEGSRGRTRTNQIFASLWASKPLGGKK